jgi:hypothetical protein
VGDSVLAQDAARAWKRSPRAWAPTSEGRARAARDRQAGARRDARDAAKTTARSSRRSCAAHDLVTMPETIDLKSSSRPSSIAACRALRATRRARSRRTCRRSSTSRRFPDSWSARADRRLPARVQHWQLRILAVHEALPGHYLQLWQANRAAPRPERAVERRVRRRLGGLLRAAHARSRTQPTIRATNSASSSSGSARSSTRSSTSACTPAT